MFATSYYTVYENRVKYTTNRAGRVPAYRRGLNEGAQKMRGGRWSVKMKKEAGHSLDVGF